ncbi:MAG: endolytic transglycosylase MltG [Gammaproteobacteria bacterium]|nr:endolytic transglycosylase MltG [Gammaproteobacteria bacterium]
MDFIRNIPRAIGVIVIIFGLGVAWLWIEIQTFADTPLQFADSEYRYTIEPGKTLKRISRELQQQGLIENADKLVWLARLQGNANHILLGEYEFNQGNTVQDLLNKFVTGDVKRYSLTLVEGWNIYQVLEAIDADPILEHRLRGLSHAQIMVKLGHPDEHPEGRFFPDTYQFSRGMSDIEFLKRAYDKMEQVLEDEWSRRSNALPYRNPYEALIMASIVEKETAVPSERGAIAGVFVRRIEKQMRLQTDPTVIYGLGQSFDGNLKKRHLLDAGNPYNTYKLKGLPPTPIALAGREAIEAALNPKDGDALYFVSRGDGSHYFSASLDEHNQAVVKYQLKGRVRQTTSMNADGSSKKDLR